MNSAVVLEVSDRIATLTLNRPDRLNAFDLEMARLIEESVQGVSERDDLRVLVITGAGRGFCAGADINYLKNLQNSSDVDTFRRLLEVGKRLFILFRRMPQLVIASVNGPAAGGGCSLALSCDLRIASDQASFGQAFIHLGMHPDWGSYWVLPRLVGPARCIEMMVLGKMILAPEALKLGLVNEVTPPHFVQTRTAEIARRAAESAPLALKFIKRGVYESYHQSMEHVLDQEVEGQVKCFLSDDSREGVDAFLEKRRPTFHGR